MERRIKKIDYYDKIDFFFFGGPAIASEVSSSMVVSLLDRLRAPTIFELTRKRKKHIHKPDIYKKVHVKSTQLVQATRNQLPQRKELGRFQINVLLCLLEHCFMTHAGRK